MITPFLAPPDQAPLANRLFVIAMAQISLTHKGIFVLVVGGITLILFLLSDGGQTGYETNPDVVSLRSVFVTLVIAVEEAGRAIKVLSDLQPANPFNLHKKPALLKLNPTGHITMEEVVTEADLLSNYCIVRRIKLLRPDFTSQINSEEREMPQQSSITLAMKSILTGRQSIMRRKHLLTMLPEQDVFLHLHQVSLWVDPLDATQEYSENLLQFVSVMGCGSIHGEPVFGVVHFPFLNATCYKMIKLALGEADLYVHAGGARRWDVCAPSAILVARGGVVRTLVGDPLHFHHNDPSDLDSHQGIFAAASLDLFNTWASTVASLISNIPPTDTYIVIGRILTELSWGLGAQIRDVYLLDYNHLDFVWGVDAASHIYRNIIHFFRQHRWSLLLRHL
ncbi:Inositol monophosphatase 3 [Echinococcus granulosus]|uniref:inositol-phosphate phosphatase n=1 Tax=Echinococcus granulosus TaxID=6210 RepID=W6UAD7_ECHGR|nr:Inositol monophosphatase 3 [Echinococcus granulosus]EUB57476.1 Inositol monophosphatase 3 [Echinococcus granulosus]